MAVSVFKPLFDRFETESAKKRRLFLEKVYNVNTNTRHLCSSEEVGEELGYDYRTTALITAYWLEKGCIAIEEGVLLNADGDGTYRTLKITAKGIDEVEKHWFKKFIDRNKNLITIVIAAVSLAISLIALFKP